MKAANASLRQVSTAIIALSVLCAATPANASCWGIDADRLPSGVASTPQGLAACSRYMHTMQVASRSAAGDFGIRTAELANLQKAYFEGFCATHPNARAYIDGAIANLRAADAYVPKPWEVELRAANVANAASDNTTAAAHEASALRLLPADASPADIGNAYEQVGCLRERRNDLAGALAAYRDGLGRIGDAPLVDRTYQVTMLFKSSTILVTMGRKDEAFDFGQRAGEAYLASQYRTITLGTQLSTWMLLLATERREPFLTLQEKVGDAMLQDTGPFVDHSRPPAAPLSPAQANAQYDSDMAALGRLQRGTSDQNMAGATADIRAAEARLAQASAGERPGIEQELLQLRIRLAELQMWDAKFWSASGDHPRAFASATQAMTTWSTLRLPESDSTLTTRIIRFKLAPAGRNATSLDAYASMYAAFNGLAFRSALASSSEVGRDDAMTIVDAAWSLSH